MRVLIVSAIFAGAMALGFFTGTLTRQKVLLPSSRAAVSIPVGAPCTNPNGCGGSCKLTINNGCGYGGCRIWEQCGGNGQCFWQGVTQSCEQYIDYNPSLQSPSEQGTDADWTCMGEVADQKVRELRNYDFATWRNDKVAKTIADCNLDTSYAYDCSSEITPECAQTVNGILTQWGFSNLANNQIVQGSQEIEVAEPSQESAIEKISNLNSPAAQLNWNPVEGTTLYSLSIRYNGRTFTRDTAETSYVVYPYELVNETGTGRWTVTAKKGDQILFTSPEYEFFVTNTQEEVIEPVAAASEEADSQYCEVITNDEAPFTLVFIPDRYSDLEEFATNIAEVIADIDSTNLPEAFKSNIRYVAYAHIPETPLTSELGNEESTSVKWDRPRAEAIKTVCNANDYMLIAKWPHKSGTAFWSGGAAIANSSVNVASHELGHNLPKLDDEYVYVDTEDTDNTSELPQPGPNCTTDSRCSLWRAQTQGIACMPGCHYGHWYRPTDNSIMRNPYISHEFNLPSMYAWENWFVQSQ